MPPQSTTSPSPSSSSSSSSSSTTPAAHVPAPPPPPPMNATQQQPPTSAPLPPFGRYWAAAFATAFPNAAAHLTHDQLADAANSYLFRFDDRLSASFIASHLDVVAATMAAPSESDSAALTHLEALRIVRRFAKDCSHAYFSHRWHDTAAYVDANTPPLLDLVDDNNTHTVLTHYLANNNKKKLVAPPHLAPVHLPALLVEHKLVVVVLVYADYCSRCDRIKPIFNDAAQRASRNHLFVSLKGATAHQFCKHFDIAAYPVILRFQPPPPPTITTTITTTTDDDDDDGVHEQCKNLSSLDTQQKQKQRQRHSRQPYATPFAQGRITDIKHLHDVQEELQLHPTKFPQHVMPTVDGILAFAHGRDIVSRIDENNENVNDIIHEPLSTTTLNDDDDDDEQGFQKTSLSIASPSPSSSASASAITNTSTTTTNIPSTNHITHPTNSSPVTSASAHEETNDDLDQHEHELTNASNRHANVNPSNSNSIEPNSAATRNNTTTIITTTSSPTSPTSSDKRSPSTNNLKINTNLRHRGTTKPPSSPPPPPPPTTTGTSTPAELPMSPRVKKWMSLLTEQGIDEIEMLHKQRQQVVNTAINSAIQCDDTQCAIGPERSRAGRRPNEPVAPRPADEDDVDHFPPLCILLGGGMGAGKTTMLNLLRATSFWKAHGESTIIVGADEFKMTDPLYHLLQGITPHEAAAIVHPDSLKAAEELLLKAVDARRDIVFDGTFAWSEYAKQTIDMLRDTQYMYTRGPGFVTGGQQQQQQQQEECYWVRTQRRDVPVVPYRVEIVGVTADADVAVMRGIVRRITSGRDISVFEQLKSHRLFSSNFERYAKLADAIYLFDTTLPGVADHDKMDYVGQLIATKPGLLFKAPVDVRKVLERRAAKQIDSETEPKEEEEEEVIVRFEEAFKRFMRKRYLNVNAKSADELYAKKKEDEYDHNDNANGQGEYGMGSSSSSSSSSSSNSSQVISNSKRNEQEK